MKTILVPKSRILLTKNRCCLLIWPTKFKRNSCSLITTYVVRKLTLILIFFVRKGFYCEPLSIPVHGGITTPCTRLPGHSCRLTCERGYNLVGSAIRWCNNDGSWTDTQPQCHGNLACIGKWWLPMVSGLDTGSRSGFKYWPGSLSCWTLHSHSVSLHPEV